MSGSHPACGPLALLEELLRRLPRVIRQLRTRQGDRPPLRVEDERDLEDLLRALLPSARSNPGVNAFEIHVAEDDPRVIWVYELHGDRASLNRQDEAARALLGDRMEALLDGPPEIHEASYADGVRPPAGRAP